MLGACQLLPYVNISLQWDNNFIDVTHKLEQYVKTTNILFKK